MIVRRQTRMRHLRTPSSWVAASSLGDEQAVTLRGVQEPQYLVGLRYDVYTGRGWESDVADTFNPNGPDGTVYSPQLTFRPQQDVALSGAVSGQTEPVTGSVTLLRPRGQLLFTFDAYLRSDLPTSVQLSWLQLENQPFDLRSEDVPADLRPLASLLLSTMEYSDGNTDQDGVPLPDDAANRDANRQRTAESSSALSGDLLGDRRIGGDHPVRYRSGPGLRRHRSGLRPKFGRRGISL